MLGGGPQGLGGEGEGQKASCLEVWGGWRPAGRSSKAWLLSRRCGGRSGLPHFTRRQA